MNVNEIILMGFFMQDLHRQIEYIYQQWADKPSLLTVYRGQHMAKCEFERLPKGQGGLLSFNSFLSTSTDRDVALIFAGTGTSEAEFIGVLFEIKINSELFSTPFILLNNMSNFAHEKEILFSMHSIFEIIVFFVD